MALFFVSGSKSTVDFSVEDDGGVYSLMSNISRRLSVCQMLGFDSSSKTAAFSYSCLWEPSQKTILKIKESEYLSRVS